MEHLNEGWEHLLGFQCWTTEIQLEKEYESCRKIIKEGNPNKIKDVVHWSEKQSNEWSILEEYIKNDSNNGYDINNKNHKRDIDHNYCTLSKETNNYWIIITNINNVVKEKIFFRTSYIGINLNTNYAKIVDPIKNILTKLLNVLIIWI